LQAFKLLRKSTGSAYRTNATVQLKPDVPTSDAWKQFITDYLMTAKYLPLSFTLTGAVINLPSLPVSIPRFVMHSTVRGLNIQVVKSATVSVSPFSALLTKKIKFKFRVGELLAIISPNLNSLK
jgi:hypothetical protein